MELQEFKELSDDEKVRLVNDRLLSLKSDKKTTRDFRCDTLNFTYVTCVSEMHKIGFVRDGDVFIKECKLSDYELRLLKNLAYSFEFVMKKHQDQPKVIQRNNDKVFTTSARVYNKVWKRWQLFCQEYSIFNSVDLMASAMEELMDKHFFDSYDTLLLSGKIKEEN